MGVGVRELIRGLKLPVIICCLAAWLGLAYSDGGTRLNPPAHRITQEQPREVLLESFFRSPRAYDDAFAAVGRIPQVRIRAGIVSHHFLARNLIAQFFAGIDPEGVRRVILVGPDHYKRLAGQEDLAAASLLPWKTPYGLLHPDGSCIQGLLPWAGAALNDGVFRREHSVYVLVPFIKKTFPQARFVPLILRSNPDYGRFLELGEKLRRTGGGDTILLVSSDFAHGVNATEARRLDRESLARLNRLDPADLGKIHADCRPCLAALAGFLGGDPGDFVLVSHKTAADFGSRDPDHLTSYITAYYKRRPRPSLSLLFLGDLMFDRGIRQVAQVKGNDFLLAGVSELLAEPALIVANLEGPLTNHPSVSLGRPNREKDHYTFTFDPSWAETLKRHRITLVHLGNNHLLDFGEDGLKQTRKNLRLAGVDYFGDPLRRDRRWVLQKIAGLRLAFVSFNQFARGSVAQTLDDIMHARPRADLVVVYAHWGREYRDQPGERLRRWGHLFVDAGADLVIGSHSHTLQPREEYRGKRIYYSLGNFIFDQYGRPETCRGLAVRVRVPGADPVLDFAEVQLSLEKNGQTTIKGK
jgi:AmmeMemoRadiSam system protein B